MQSLPAFDIDKNIDNIRIIIYWTSILMPITIFDSGRIFVVCGCFNVVTRSDLIPYIFIL